MADQGIYSYSFSPLKIPYGFRFDPTDEELILEYVKKKNEGYEHPVLNFPEASPYEKHPAKTLPADFKFGIRNHEHYIFTELDLKNGGSRVRRSTLDGAGFWKMTITDKEINDSRTKETIGYVTTFTFYEGSSNKKKKSDWIMHQFRYEPSVKNAVMCSTNFKKRKITGFVLCRIYRKITSPASRNYLEAMDFGKECVPIAPEEVEAGPIPHSTPRQFPLHHQTTSCPTGKGITDPDDPHINQLCPADGERDLESRNISEFVYNDTAMKSLDTGKECVPMAAEELEPVSADGDMLWDYVISGQQNIQNCS